MASISLPKVLTQRRSGSIEVERETFWKSQTSSIGKAINHQETPVKEKHVRSAIIGTYHEKGSTTFWAVVGTLQIQENPIVCWKFCHTLHKLLREGHPNVLPESQAYRQRIRELGKYWGHLRHNFGKLISCYCRLLVIKLEFHSKNPKFPGNLQLTNEQLEAIGEMDINNYFQITVEMFDFMDEILTLQAAVFGSLETGRANSMTMSGQCRLAPLIPCIQDSSHLYDYLVKLLYKLHSSLPPDVLLGHRDRFYKQFKVLRDFYKNTSILQYFKHLIQIPLLPEEPPNFLIKSGIHSHVSPVVILPPQDDTADTDSVDMSLIDTTSPPLLELEPTNGTSTDINYEKDRLIERLQQEIEYLKREIQRIRLEDQQVMEELRHQLAAVQGKLSALQQQLLSKNGEIEVLRAKAVSAEKNVQAAEKFVEAEKKAKTSDDKFQKMKDVYYKLREEHIALLRAKADVEKQLVLTRQENQDSDKGKSAVNEQIKVLKQQLEEAKRCQTEAEMKNKELEAKPIKRKVIKDFETTGHKRRIDEAKEMMSSSDEKLSVKDGLRNILRDKSEYEAALQESMETNRELNHLINIEHDLNTALMDSERSIESKTVQKSEIEGNLEKSIERSTSVIAKLNEQKENLSKERMELDSKLAHLADEQMEAESGLQHNPKLTAEKLQLLEKMRDVLETKESAITAQLQLVNTSKECAESDLNEAMETANAQLRVVEQEIDKLQNDKMGLRDKLEKITKDKLDLISKLNTMEDKYMKMSADALAESQDMDEMLMNAVDEMYLAQNQQLTNSTEIENKFAALENEKKSLVQRIKALENNINLENGQDGIQQKTSQEITVATIQENKNLINAERRDLENKLAMIFKEEQSLEDTLRDVGKQRLGMIDDESKGEELFKEEEKFREKLKVVQDEKSILEKTLQSNMDQNKKQLEMITERHHDLDLEKQELEEMLLAALDEKYITENAVSDESELKKRERLELVKQQKALTLKSMELEGRLKNALDAKSRIENAFKESSLKSGHELTDMFPNKRELGYQIEGTNSQKEKSVAEIQEDKNRLNSEKRDLKSKMTVVLNEKQSLGDALRNIKRQQLGALFDANDEERRELEEMLFSAIDESFVAQQLMDERIADEDERYCQLDRERKVLIRNIMLLEGKLENALNAKSRIEDSFKGTSTLNAQEITVLIEIKNDLENKIGEMTNEMQKIGKAADAVNEESKLENTELEELLLTAVDEAHIAELMLQERSQEMEDRYSVLSRERLALKTKVLELEGRLENVLHAKSSVENAFLESAALSAEDIAKVVAIKTQLEEKTRDVTEQLQKMIATQEKTMQQNMEINQLQVAKNEELLKAKENLEEKLKGLQGEKSVLEKALHSNQEQNQKQLEMITEKHHDLDLEKQELEEMLLAALDEKYMTESAVSEESELIKKERLELIKQREALKMKSMELEGRLANALNAKSRIEKAFQESSSASGQELSQVLSNKQELEHQVRDTLTKLEKALAEKESADKRAQEKIDEASKQVLDLLREKQELELKNLGLEESLALVSSEKAIFERNLQHTSDRLAKEMRYMEEKHGDLDMEKQELEEMLLAAVDETYMAEQMMKETSDDIQQEKNELIQERNILRRKVMEFEGKLDNALAAKDTIQQAFQENSAKLGQQLAYITNEKYILEDEILSLRMQLSSESDARMQAQQTQITNFEKLSEDLKNNVSGLESQLLEVTEQKIAMEQQVADLTGIVARLESEVESIKKDSEEKKQKAIEERKQRQFEILVSCIEEAEVIVKNALINVDDETTTPLTCSPEYLLNCGGSVLDTLERVKREHCLFNLNQDTDVDSLLRSVTAFSHLLSQFLLEGKATFNATADIEQGNQLIISCKKSGNDTLAMLASMKKKGNVEEVESNINTVSEDIKNACDAVESLISLAAAQVEDKIEDLVERELAEMDRAIEEAAARIADILSKSREAETGIKLEVSEKILDTCTALMESIRVLVKRSKELQLEIVAQGKGHNSAKEFYKKNHQWTEGLLSAAKAVGMGAKFLVDAADKVVAGQAKFELLVAASQEIAASTAQLVVASKVKADPGSQNLLELSKASSTVRGCTGTVVATVKDCAQMIDEKDIMDFSGLSLHQAKRLEMESQVKVLELENNLEKERVKLAILRKRHYTLAGPGAGWEDEESK